jgi:hypothetical protein
MAPTTEPHETRARSEEQTAARSEEARREPAHCRSEAGSLLFPDLVWAHYAWQSRTRPHRFRLVRGQSKDPRRRGLRKLCEALTAKAPTLA